jgi:hypothetical protein
MSHNSNEYDSVSDALYRMGISTEWPKIVKTYVRGSKENGWDLGAELGLEGEALKQFTYLNYEVELTIRVQKDGSYVITHVDGFPVSDKMEE